MTNEEQEKLKDALICATVEYDGECCIVVNAGKAPCRTILKSIAILMGFTSASWQKLLDEITE